MIESLLEESYYKAGVLCEKKSLHARSVFLAELLTEEYKCSITDKSLRRYYKKESNPKREVLNGLAQFLEFDDYEDYVKKKNPQLLNPSLQDPKKVGFLTKKQGGRHRKSTKGALILLLGLLLLGTAYHGLMKEGQDCIRWTGEQYKAVNCSGNRMEIAYRQDLLDNFRKIQVSDTTRFFISGKPRIWYMKIDGQLEYFTAPGLHPVSGKTLRPITPYMIEKYVTINASRKR